MARRRTRSATKLKREKLYDAKLTPSHFVRLERLRVEVPTDLRWYVVRIDPKREKKVREGLEAAGFATCSPAEVEVIGKKASTLELRQHAAPGSLFVGVKRREDPTTGKEVDGKQLLWGYHHRFMATPDRQEFVNDRTGEVYSSRVLGETERPFYDVLGPLKAQDLQGFSDRVGKDLVAVLYAGGEPICTFPAGAARIFEGQRMDFCSADDPGLANQSAAC
ncbi:transcription termination/antitermination NusG family protein [Methylobacterium sp. yr596]|uniref:transcription termination/antitermination NusG family protein n=1 Tax=Methylobacterium sp. yr596 TaxID=1761800 RepID=UPI0008F3FE8B|nr:transcription termination/antitermination NusG family protein [Methylobacterium sp. yr596]SFF77004.1 Transcription termination factor nusG [Methylobacterium sp. yr596]